MQKHTDLDNVDGEDMYDEEDNLDQQGESQLMLDEEIDPDQYYDSEAEQDFLDG